MEYTEKDLRPGLLDHPLSEKQAREMLGPLAGGCAQHLYARASGGTVFRHWPIKSRLSFFLNAKRADSGEGSEASAPRAERSSRAVRLPWWWFVQQRLQSLDQVRQTVLPSGVALPPTEEPRHSSVHR